MELLKEDFSVICIDNFVNSIKGKLINNLSLFLTIRPAFEIIYIFALDPSDQGKTRPNFVNK